MMLLILSLSYFKNASKTSIWDTKQKKYFYNCKLQYSNSRIYRSTANGIKILALFWDIKYENKR